MIHFEAKVILKNIVLISLPKVKIILCAQDIKTCYLYGLRLRRIMFIISPNWLQFFFLFLFLFNQIRFQDFFIYFIFLQCRRLVKAPKTSDVVRSPVYVFFIFYSWRPAASVHPQHLWYNHCSTHPAVFRHIDTIKHRSHSLTALYRTFIL